MGKIYGYARVSTTEQNLDRQIDALSQYVDTSNIVVDKASGKNTDREGYKALKGALGLRKGDILYITSLDRLSRNKESVKEEIAYFKENDIELKILDLPTTLIEVPAGQEWIKDMITNILVEVLASMAEQERLNIRKRQREGIDAAKKRGKYLGRPKLEMPEEFPEIYEIWKRGDITAIEAMRRLKLKRTSFYKLVSKYQTKSS